MKKYVLWLFWVCFCLPVWAGGYNIAPKAQVTASSFVSDEYSPQSIIDGIIGVDGKGEWASKGEINYWGQCKFPWVKLSWNEKHWINRIVLYDRVNEYDHIAAIVLEASNGYSKSFHGIPNNGTPFVIDLPNIEVEWLNFRVIDGDGKDLGFSEIEVFPSPEGYEDWVSWVNPFVETIPTRFFYFITPYIPKISVIDSTDSDCLCGIYHAAAAYCKHAVGLELFCLLNSLQYVRITWICLYSFEQTILN